MSLYQQEKQRNDQQLMIQAKVSILQSNQVSQRAPINSQRACVRSYKKTIKGSDTPTETPPYVTRHHLGLFHRQLSSKQSTLQTTKTNLIFRSALLIPDHNHPLSPKMAEPQPSTIHEGSSTPTPLPASNKSEAQALNSLDTPASANETSKSSSSGGGDAKALNHAMKNLDVKEKKAEVKKVKVEVGDIGMLVSLLLRGIAWRWCEEDGRSGQMLGIGELM